MRRTRFARPRIAQPFLRAHQSAGRPRAAASSERGFRALEYDDAYPFPSILFDQGRKLGATVGYAHFNGGLHSTLLMDLAIGRIDFIEVFQFGV